MNLPLHGSNPDRLYEALGIDRPDHIIDFSVNINPLGSLPVIKEKWSQWFPLIEDYPDPSASRLTALIAEEEKLPPEAILIGNGASQLIALLANYFASKHIGIVEPTFIEYEKMCQRYQARLTSIQLREDDWKDLSPVIAEVGKVDAIFLCHPNNPTGTLYDDRQLEQLLHACEEANTYLIIDEAFLPFVEQARSRTSFLHDHAYLIVLKSLTKMYSIAGLRLGYMAAHPEVVRALKGLQAEWSINAIALEAGVYCIQDRQYREKTAAYIKKQRLRLSKDLRALGYHLSDSAVNYYLLRDPQFDQQNRLITYLLSQGIVPRHTENFKGLDGRWIRLSIRKEADNDRLLYALAKWKGAIE